jgi:MYXO-CTERM domain-containing protein
VTPSAPLGQGAHTVRATATDAVGNTGPASQAVAFTVDTMAPGAPVVTTPADGSRVSTPTPVFAGSAEPGSTVRVLLDESELGTATADASGAWSLTVTSALSEGVHTVAATATDAAGNVSAPSAANAFTVVGTTGRCGCAGTPSDGPWASWGLCLLVLGGLRAMRRGRSTR